MKKEVLSEIDQMKYLFGYKAGKVISEQANAPVTADTKPQGFTNEDGLVYKFPGIADQAKLQNFREVGKVKDFPTLFGIPQSHADKFIRDVSKLTGSDLYSASKADPLWNLVQATRMYLDLIAQQGITPERFSEPSVRNWLKGQSRPKEFLDIAFREGGGGISMNMDEYLNKLSDLVKNKMKSL